jgi:adenylate kinase family enzyme
MIGPTGSGKTPVGQLFEQKGFHDKTCVHFDFGAELRKIADMEKQTNVLDCKEKKVVQKVLLEGALLEDHQFSIAYKILVNFAQEKHYMQNHVLILNGLPRHEGQAESMSRFATIQQIIYLACTPDVIFARIHNNTGGDRTERTDDSISKIKTKLELFKKRTVRLLDWYKKKNVPILKIDIESNTSPQETYDRILGML